jgi:hypothetical protein
MRNPNMPVFGISILVRYKYTASAAARRLSGRALVDAGGGRENNGSQTALMKGNERPFAKNVVDADYFVTIKMSLKP